MGTEIRRAAVLGAGVMGSGIAAHLANAGIPVVLLDIVPPELTEEDEKKGLTKDDPRFRNKFSAAGLEGIKKSKPAALYSKRFLPLIEIGNFEDDWDRLAECDWIVEVVVERLDIKQKVFARVDEVRKPGSIISSNTSGLSIAGMTEGRSEDFQAALPGHPLLQPGALHAAPRTGGRREDQPRDPRFLHRFRSLPPRQRASSSARTPPTSSATASAPLAWPRPSTR